MKSENILERIAWLGRSEGNEEKIPRRRKREGGKQEASKGSLDRSSRAYLKAAGSSLRSARRPTGVCWFVTDSPTRKEDRGLLPLAVIGQHVLAKRARCYWRVAAGEMARSNEERGCTPSCTLMAQENELGGGILGERKRDERAGSEVDRSSYGSKRVERKP